MILWDWLPSFPPVSLAFFRIHPFILPFLSLQKNDCTLYWKTNISCSRICQYLGRYPETWLQFLFLWLLCVYSLCIRYFTCNLIPVDHLLPLLYYCIKCVDIKALKGFLLSKTSTFCVWEQEAIAFSQAPLVGAEHSRGGVSSCFSFRVQYCLSLISFSSFRFAHFLSRFSCWQTE